MLREAEAGSAASHDPEQLTGTGRHAVFNFFCTYKLDFHPTKNMYGKTRITVGEKNQIIHLILYP